jgi:LysM repeat protein
MKNVFAYSLAILAFCMPVNSALAQGTSDVQRISDLEQDVQALKEQIGQMRISMEEIQRQNEALRAQQGKSGANAANSVTSAQLDAQLANLRAEMTRAQIAQKNEIVDEVGRQMDRLAHQTQQAIQAQAPAPAAAEPAATAETAFSDNFPKTGVSYTVQKGDTLSAIARKTGSTAADIRNANHISDPSKVRVGQTLFIPQRAK